MMSKKNLFKILCYAIIIASIVYPINKLFNMQKSNNEVVEQIINLVIREFEYTITLIDNELLLIETQDLKLTDYNKVNIDDIYQQTYRIHMLLKEIKKLNKSFDRDLYFFYEYIRHLRFGEVKIEETDFIVLKELVNEGNKIRIPATELIEKKHFKSRILNYISPSIDLINVFDNVERLSKTALESKDNHI